MDRIKELFEIFPVVAILGPRQCGKSTLAQMFLGEREDTVFLDLERASDLRQLNDPELMFRANRNRLVCLDEIQQRPDLFPPLRVEVDADRRPGRFLILGSAAPELLRQGSETLAGRIGFVELTPLGLLEVMHPPSTAKPLAEADNETAILQRYWLRGGFPSSYLAVSDRAASLWLESFVRTYVERDIPALGLKLNTANIRNLLWMLASHQGQMINFSRIGGALGLSSQTIRNYLQLLEGTFLVRVLPPYTPNIKKRIVKSPRSYLRDTGLLHSLLEISEYNRLLGHTAVGASWEGLAIEQILHCFAVRHPRGRFGFYRTTQGAEVDLVLETHQQVIAIECKASLAPVLTRGCKQAVKDVNADMAYVVTPTTEPSYPLNKMFTVIGVAELVERISRASSL